MAAPFCVLSETLAYCRTCPRRETGRRKCARSLTTEAFDAGVAYWLGIGSPVRTTEFDSPRPLHAGVAQVEEHRTRNARRGVSTISSGSTISPGRPLRSRRQSEKLDKHVRLVLLAPSVTVAEWLRRATVDRSTRVQFSPVTPFSFPRASFNGSGYPATNRETWGFESLRPRHFSARRPKDRAQPSEV